MTLVTKRSLHYDGLCWVMECVPVLDQHTCGDDVYDLDRLKRIADTMNRRTPAAIVIGHTSDDGDEQEIVGYADNWRVVDGYLCCDMHFYDKETPKRYPRRSAEIWVDYDVVDPIALLGSSPPARPLPLVVPEHSADAVVAKFSYNKHGMRVRQYSLPELPGDSTMPMEQYKDIVTAVLDAVKDTPEWKFLSELLNEWQQVQELLEGQEKEAPEKSEEAEEDVEKKDMEHDEGHDAEGDKEHHDEHDEDEMLKELIEKTIEEHGEQGKKDDEHEGHEDVDKKDLGAGEVFTPKMVKIEQAKVSKLSLENRLLKRKYELALLKAEGYAIDPETEAQITIEMSDENFSKYLTSLRNRALRTPGAATIPVKQSLANEHNLDADTVRKIVKYALENQVSYDEAKKRVLGIIQ